MCSNWQLQRSEQNTRHKPDTTKKAGHHTPKQNLGLKENQKAKQIQVSSVSHILDNKQETITSHIDYNIQQTELRSEGKGHNLAVKWDSSIICFSYHELHKALL